MQSSSTAGTSAAGTLLTKLSLKGAGSSPPASPFPGSVVPSPLELTEDVEDMRATPVVPGRTSGAGGALYGSVLGACSQMGGGKG